MWRISSVTIQITVDGNQEMERIFKSNLRFFWHLFEDQRNQPSGASRPPIFTATPESYSWRINYLSQPKNTKKKSNG